MCDEFRDTAEYKYDAHFSEGAKSDPYYVPEPHESQLLWNYIAHQAGSR